MTSEAQTHNISPVSDWYGLRRKLRLGAVRLFETSRFTKQWAILSVDMTLLPLGYATAVLCGPLGSNFSPSLRDFGAMALTMLGSALIFRKIGLYRAIIRFMGQQAIWALIQASFASSLLLSVAIWAFGPAVPWTTPILYWGVVLLAIGGSRLGIRAFYHSVLRRAGDVAAIYGAGRSGRHLLASLRQNRSYRPAAFIDDDPHLVGTVIDGVTVHHPDSIEELIEAFSLSHVFLALPSASRRRRGEILTRLEPYALHVKTVPDLHELVMGDDRSPVLKEVEIEDLLGRDPVPPHAELIAQCVRDKVVMVTGGGGSIGSELCRQILHCQPQELLVVDMSEHALYQIDRELNNLAKTLRSPPAIVPIMASVRDRARIESICREYGVQTMYHAAAYKHVPLVEYNMAEGVANNVFGTLNAARAAQAAGVERFVLISTDKAVRPTNVMGASKRMAELVLQGMATPTSGTCFSMVRFGNVLGSSGSVVPLFRQQIAAKGPVTVTDPEVTRYFMTIPEAAQLVLQAGAMGTGGDVFLLDMGESVKIVELARRMIRLMGLEVKDAANPGGDIAIEFTGLRPGEKLYEELLIKDDPIDTEHPRIRRAKESSLSESAVEEFLAQLRAACNGNDCEKIVAIFKVAVDGFTHEDGISDKVWSRRSANHRSRRSVSTPASRRSPAMPAAIPTKRSSPRPVPRATS